MVADVERWSRSMPAVQGAGSPAQDSSAWVDSSVVGVDIVLLASMFRLCNGGDEI